MAEDMYNKKLESLQQFIPFLDNMILQLKDPSKKNREQQLNKMMSLHAMITDKRKKLKLETLIKCEDVISKLYEKVHNKPLSIKKGSDNLSLTPASPSPPREIITPQPLTIPTERLEERRIPKIDIYSSAAESLIRPRMQPNLILGARVPDMSKPPISLEDLKTLEDDVQEKINETSLKAASLQELNNLREKLTEQIHMEEVLLKSPQKQRKDDLEAINTTVRNSLSLTKKLLHSPEKPEKPKNKEKENSKLSSHKSGESSSSASSPKKEHKNSQSTANKSPKILKEPDSIFGSILSHIDDQILGGKKKKEDRRNSITGTDDKKSSDKDVKKKERKHSGSKEDFDDERKESKDAKKKEKSSDSVEEKSKTRDDKKSDLKKKERHRGDKSKSKDDKKDSGNSTKGDKSSFSLTGKKSFETEEQLMKKVLENTDNSNATDVNKEQTEVGQISVKKGMAFLKSASCSNTEEESPKQTQFKRLADKYHPKPRKASTEPDVDKELSDIIEEKMKTSPPKVPLINQLPEPVPPPASLILCSQLEPEPVPKLPPAVLQNILAPGTTELINNVVSQLRQNTADIEAKKMPLPHPSSAENFVSEYVREDNSNSEYVREDFAKDEYNPNVLASDYNKFQPAQMRRERLNFEPPSPHPNNQFNQMPNHNLIFAPLGGDGHNDNFPPNRPFTPRPQGFPQPSLNIQSKPYDLQSLDYYPPNAPIPSNQYNCGPPLLSPEVPHFHNEQKPGNFGMMPNHDPFRQNEDMRWRQDESNFNWERRDQDFRLNRDPRTYREYREMRESRDPRVAGQNRDPRENLRDPRAIRDPRVNRDLRENRDPRENRDFRENRDSRERDPRLNKDRADSRDFDRDRSRFRDNRQTKDNRPSRYDTRFDMMYSRTNRDRSRSRSRSRTYGKETFVSPLDSLYSGKEEQKTGKGYGVQNFRIPKIKKEDEKEQSTKVSSSNDDGNADDALAINDDSNDSTNEVTGNNVEFEEIKDPKQQEETDEGKESTQEKVVTKEAEVDKTDLEPPKLLDETEETKAVEDHKPTPSVQPTEQDHAKPADQTILAQFFANLLGSKNKKDKKTALYSLISTFSDSFSEKELSKITKIIKADDETDNSEEEEEVKKPEEKPKIEEVKEPEKEPDTEVHPDSPVKIVKRKTRKRIRRISSASSKEDKTKEEVPTTPEPLEIPPVDQDNVVVSVGERIKSRKRASVTPPKPKKKFKTELDMLHEDIQDMFIRDGVLTASGKRMCRLLKDDPNALNNPQSSSSVEPPKVRKKPGPKPKQKSISTDMKTVKNIRVLIQKIPDSSLEQKDESPRRTLRSTSKTVYAESDDDDNSTQVDDDSVLGDGSFRGESDVESTDTEKDKSQTTDNTNKAKVTKRKRGKGWACGNIPSNRKKKKKQLPVEESSDATNAKSAGAAESDVDKSFIEPDKNYYIDFTSNKSHECKLCNYQGRFITTHYKSQHRESEVLTSRFSPSVALEAIDDSKKNLSRYEGMMKTSGSGKYHFTCRFCAFNTTVPPTIFYDHITTHTGEYRHICPMCDNFSAPSGKTLKSHMNNVHNNVEKRVARKTYSQTIIFAYMCGECNYVQLNQKSVEDHINIFHLQKPKIYKVNMSTIVDPQIIKLAETDQKNDELITASAEDGEVNSEEGPLDSSKGNQTKVVPKGKAMPPPQVRKRSKAAPKCVKEKLKAKQALLEKEGSASDTSSTAETESGHSIASEKVDTPVQNLAKPVSKRRLTREVSINSEEDLIISGRSRRAAKDKAAEKLKSLMETSESGPRKRSFSALESENRNEKEEDKKANQTDTKGDKKEEEKIAVIKTVDEKVQIKKEVELNVFTCKTDIQEENKKIEQERLHRMQELNKSVGSRVSLNFVDKLCDLLKKSDVTVKQEPRDDLTESLFQTNALDTSLTMPVLEKNSPIPPISDPILTKPPVTRIPPPKKPVLETEGMSMSNSSFDVTQKNDKVITDMIQKLKGKLANNAEDLSKNTMPVEVEDVDYDSEGPPPLTHVHELPNVKPADGSTKTLLIGGLVKVIKYPSCLMFSCLVPPCVFSSENKEAFQKHCSEAHKQQDRSTLCEMCGMEIVATTECTLLENIFKHAIREHEDFMNDEDKPEKKSVVKVPTVLRIRKLSGDALSLKKEEDAEVPLKKYEIPKPEVAFDETSQPEEPPASVAELEMSDENPFPFKIAGVMSLAEPVPPLTPIAKTMQVTSATHLVVKEAKMSQAELSRPRKTNRALNKFVASVSDLYKCPYYYCLFSTNFRYFIERHLKAHKVEQNEMIPCVYCDMKTPWEHVPMHIDIRHAHCRYACSYCLYRAVLKEYVFLHQDQMHPEKDYSVIALPQAKHSKRWAIADVKVDPRTLCKPYRCTNLCGLEFLFENEFRKHLQDVHKSNFVPCGYKNCSHRVQANKMPHHWALNHSVSLYQCGYCKMNSNEMKNMYKHFSQVHQGLQPDILIRMHTETQEGVSLGYTPEAFALLRKVVTIPSNICGENKSDTLPVEPETVPADTSPSNCGITSALTTVTSLPQIVTQGVLIPSGKSISPSNCGLTSALTTVTSLPQTVTQGVLIPSGKSMISHALTLVSTKSPTPSGGNIFILPKGASGMVMSQEVTSDRSDNGTLKVVTSGAATEPVIPALLDITEKNQNVQEDTRKDDQDVELAIEPLEHITLGEDNNQTVTEENDPCEADPLSLDTDLDVLDVSKSAADSSGDESEGNKQDKTKMSGLQSYDLYRCAFCKISFSNSADFKKHVTNSNICRIKEQVSKPYVCAHCEKRLKSPPMLFEHVQCHGVLRFSCSLCGNKFPTIAQTRNHIKNRHNITHTFLTPLNPAKQNIDVDEYLVRPKQLGSTKDVAPVEQGASTSVLENVYTPETVDNIPMRHILNYTAKCGLCSYSTKVRTNMVRHLQFHSEEKMVSDTAPVNPVPCLEKNEKMFDKMINLASSSHANSRMGGSKQDAKEETNYPEFVPSHCRYVCCAHGCNYICPEEGNLRHHLIALHDGETSFTCVHCKASLPPTDADGLIKHFKLHGLQLYKCTYCNFIHNLRHKVEKHVSDNHPDLLFKVITVRFMESEPKDAVQEPATPNPPSASAPAPAKFNKPWRCCMCKYKTSTSDGIQHHILEKHEIDAQFKCALCSYKTDDKDTFPDHFKTSHDNQTVDIIYVYRKMDKEDKEKEVEAFDTTPLWQRDRPRVRHIRGILFDDSTPTPAKSPKKAKSTSSPGPSGVKLVTSSAGPSGVKVTAPSPGPTVAKIIVPSQGPVAKSVTPSPAVSRASAPSPSPGGSRTATPTVGLTKTILSSENEEKATSSQVETSSMDQSIESVVNGTADILKESSSCVSDDLFQTVNKLMKDSTETIAKVKQSAVIVIDDEDEPKTPVVKDKDNKDAPVAKNRTVKRKAVEVSGASKAPKISDEIIDLESSGSGSDSEQDEFSERNLKRKFGEFGSPLWKQFRCPKCNLFKSKRISDFVFHVFKEVKKFRFMCKLCTEESITYRYMHKHVRERHQGVNCEDNITSLTPSEDLLVWLQMVIREQSLIVMQNYPNTPRCVVSGDNLVPCDFCKDKFCTEQEKNEHSVSHWTAKPYFCTSCTYSSFVENDVRRHFTSIHGGILWKTKDMVFSRGPTVQRLLKISDEQHMKEALSSMVPEVPALTPLQSTTPETFQPVGDVPAHDQLTTSDILEVPGLMCDEKISEKEDDAALSDSDLIIITKTENTVPTENDIFCCEYCAFMSSTEAQVLSHITAEHDHMTINFKRLNRETCEDPKEHVGCMLCPEVGSEVKVRQHYMEKHAGHALNLYRFQCGICVTQKRFYKFLGLKAHFSRLHTGSQLQYSSLYGSGVNESIRTGLKTYKCIVCPYERNLKPSAVNNVRQHVKQHFKAFLCGICRALKYKTRADVLAHYAKEHPEVENRSVMQDTQIQHGYNSAMAAIIANATDYAGEKIKKNTAKKSTSAPSAASSTPEYSFYGTKPEPVEMHKISTTMMLNNMPMEMTAEKLSKILDLDVKVVLEDCNLSVNLSSVFDS